jgi:hypothetical protein
MIDYFRVGSLLAEAERLYRDRIRKFVDEECMPLIADYFDKGTFPRSGSDQHLGGNRKYSYTDHRRGPHRNFSLPLIENH